MPTDSLAISTQGFITSSPYENNSSLTIASQGFLVRIVEEVIEEPIPDEGGGITGESKAHFDKAYKKKITLEVTFPDGEVYEATQIVDDLNLVVSDIEIFKSDSEMNITLENVNLGVEEKVKRIKLIKKEFL